MSDDKLEARKKKKVALVDIDGCLLINGELNLNLVKRLREGGYDEIILFTQRSKFVQSLNLPTKAMTDDKLKSTADAVASLSEELAGKPIKVSTSVDYMFGKQFAYFEQLKSFEELFLANANNRKRLGMHEDYVKQIEGLKKKLETAEEPEHSKLNKAKLDLEKLLIPEAELAEIYKLEAQIQQEIKNEKSAIAQYVKEHPEYKTTDPEGYPVNKQQQLKELRKELTQDGSELEEDYFDDSYLNLLEFEDLETPPNRFMILGDNMIPFKQVGEDLKKINAEITQLRVEYEKVIRDTLGMNVSIVLEMKSVQINDLQEPHKTAVTKLQKLVQIQDWINNDTQKSLGKGLATAQHYMSSKASPNIQDLKEELKKTYIKTVYSPANLEKPRKHDYEVTTETVVNASQEFKSRYQNMKGDELKTHILLNFKSKIEQFKTTEEIQEYLKAFKDTNEYKTLEIGQGAFTRVAHKLGLKKWITTDSVDAIDKIVKDTMKKIEEKGIEHPEIGQI